MSDTTPLHRAAGSGETRNVLGMIHTNIATPAETGGAFLMLEARIAPGLGAPMHRHESDAECFHILEGELTFVTPDGEFVGRAGDTCYLPVGSEHAFANRGDVDVRALIVTTPGTDAMAFFDEIDAKIGAGAPDVAAVTAIASRNGLEILPPAA